MLAIFNENGAEKEVRETYEHLFYESLLTSIRTLYQYGYATSFYTNSGIVIRIFPKTHTSRLFWRLLTSPLDSSQKITPRDISPPCMSIVGSKRPTLPKITTHDVQTLVNFLRMQNPARPRGIGKIIQMAPLFWQIRENR